MDLGPLCPLCDGRKGVCPVCWVKLWPFRFAKQCRDGSEGGHFSSLNFLLVLLLCVLSQSIGGWCYKVATVGSGLRHVSGGVFEDTSGGEIPSLFGNHPFLGLDQEFPFIHFLFVKSVFILIIHFQEKREWPFEMTPIVVSISC